MGAHSRNKGADFERKIARQGRDAGLDSERQIQQKRVADVADVHVTTIPANTIPAVVLLECKNYKKPTLGLIRGALTQCEGYVTNANQIPAAVIHVPNATEDIVCISTHHFWRLIGAPPAGVVTCGESEGECS